MRYILVECNHIAQTRKDIFGRRGRKEGNVLFNDALNTFYVRLYGVGLIEEMRWSQRKRVVLFVKECKFCVNV